VDRLERDLDRDRAAARRLADRDLDLLFARRNFSVTNLETFVVYGGLSAWGFFLVLFLQQLAGYSPFRAGLATVPVTIVLFLLSRLVGRFSMRLGPRAFMAAGPLLAGASGLVAIAAIGIAAASGTQLSTQGFHRAMLIVAALLATAASWRRPESATRLRRSRNLVAAVVIAR
jgi:predicted MFS family arabinose efflux permease